MQYKKIYEDIFIKQREHMKMAKKEIVDLRAQLAEAVNTINTQSDIIE